MPEGHWPSNTRGNYQQKEQMETKKSCNEDTHLDMGRTTWGYIILKENTTRQRYAMQKKILGANDCLPLCCACNYCNLYVGVAYTGSVYI